MIDCLRDMTAKKFLVYRKWILQIFAHLGLLMCVSLCVCFVDVVAVCRLFCLILFFSPACPRYLFGENCTRQCHCRNNTEVCDSTYGVCRSGCAPGWVDSDCQRSQWPFFFFFFFFFYCISCLFVT